jgi:hypothetical protein
MNYNRLNQQIQEQSVCQLKKVKSNKRKFKNRKQWVNNLRLFGDSKLILKQSGLAILKASNGRMAKVKFFNNNVHLIGDIVKARKTCFLFETVRFWEFSPVWTDFDNCHNLSKRNVKLILKILSDLEPLRGSSKKKNVVFNSLVCNLGLFWHSFQKMPNPLKNSLYKLILI